MQFASSDEMTLIVGKMNQMMWLIFFQGQIGEIQHPTVILLIKNQNKIKISK